MTDTNAYRLIRVSAPTAFERGAQYGAQAKEEVAACLDMYKAHLCVMKDVDWQAAREEAQRYLPLVSAALPIETEMLHGVAEGSGASFEDILVLNVRYEILHYPKEECTTYAVLRSATREGKVFIGQNWDQRPIVMPHAIVLHITMEDGTRIMGVTEAGQLLRNGFNSHGLGLVSSGLNSSADSRRVGVPGNFMRMRALRSRSFDEMREVTTAFCRAVANNYTLASARDDLAVDVEGLPEMPVVLPPENGIVTHANHILSHPEMDTSKGKRIRGERLNKLLQERTGDITADYIKKCLSDHEGYPDSVCSHAEEDKRDVHHRWMTVASIIYDLDEATASICKGNPCRGTFTEYRL